jgi:hypothetical protein
MSKCVTMLALALLPSALVPLPCLAQPSAEAAPTSAVEDHAALALPALAEVSETASAEALPPLPQDALALPALELPPLAAPNAAEKKRWLSHYIALDTSIFPGQLPEGVDRAWFELSYRPRLSGELGAGFSLTAEVLLRASLGKRAAPLALRGEGNSFRLFSGGYHTVRDRQAVLFKDALVSWAGHGLECAVGYQVFSWGKADGVRPLDVFRIEDLSDPLRAEALGIPAVSASYGRAGFTLEGVWVPFMFSNRLAIHAENPWSITPRDEGVRFASRRHALDFSDWELGLRLSYSDQAWDLSLQSSRTRERSPSLLRAVPDEAGATLQPEFARAYVHGASLLRSLGRFLLKADLAYVDYAAEHAPLLGDGVRLVAGAEARGQLGANGSYAAVLQYALDTTTPGKLATDGDLISSPYHWFRHAALGKLKSIVSPRFDAELSVLVELEHGSTVASATLTYHPTDDTSLWCEGSYVAGRKETWIGRIDFADRMVVGVAFNTNS